MLSSNEAVEAGGGKAVDAGLPRREKVTVRKVFHDRLIREGRAGEWMPLVRKIMAETGKGFYAASYDAMRQLGYTGAEDEWRRHRQYVAGQKQARMEQQLDATRQEIRQEKVQEDFEECVRGLPPVAPVAQEIQWISIHPAMNRLDRQKDKTKGVVLTGCDVLTSTAGKAPSQRAVRQLQHWANAPREFFKQILGEDKKKTGGGPGREAEVDADLEEVERLLRQIREQHDGARRSEFAAGGSGEVDLVADGLPAAGAEADE